MLEIKKRRDYWLPGFRKVEQERERWVRLSKGNSNEYSDKTLQYFDCDGGYIT